MNPRIARKPAFHVIAGIFLAGLLGHAAAVAGALVATSHGGREMLVFVPSTLPATGTRALVIVLHGGLGNAQRIAMRESEGGLNLDAVAEKDGFVVAYLDGTPVTRNLGPRFLGWNAGGGCCGQSFERNVDDVGYIRGAVDDLAQRYGIDQSRVYGIGHSNGAMMTQRVVCETGLYAAAIAISGPLNLPTPRCGAASGRRILAIHGADDRNVPVDGGVGTKGLSRVAFRSEEESRSAFAASGATYTLQVVRGADHALAPIDAVLVQTEGTGIAGKAAAWFGLDGAKP